VHTLSSGNIICSRDPCYGRFNAYKDWAAGIEAHFELLNDYAEGRSPSGKHHETIDSAIEEWAPRTENDTDGYIAQVHEMVGGWRRVAAPRPVEQQPAGAAFVQSKATGGFVEPFEGFFDKQCQGLHEGARDYCAPEGTVVKAPVNGKFVTTGHYEDELRFGDYFMFLDDSGREWYFGHLKEVNPLNLQPGERVQAGMEMGKLGPFPHSEPHTHNQLRVNGELTDPLPVYEEIRSQVAQEQAKPIQIELPTSLPSSHQVYTSPALTSEQGCVWTNTLAAAQHNEGLRHITLKPGESWSHNEAWASGEGQVWCGAILAGGQCDMAGRYLNVAHQMGLQDGSDLLWANHNTDLPHLDYADEVVIDTEEYGTRNGADLVIVNNTQKTLRMEAQAVGESFTVRGWWE
jgi:Peptidase family M23